MTAQQLITDHLDLWTSAHKTRSIAGRGSNNKLNLHGIKKLRELILELAVRGKLVPQDPTDEPASELLQKISAEKEKLIKEGKIKKEKPLPEFTIEEKPFELPDGWEPARLGEIINVLNGRAYKKHEMLSEGTPLLRVGNLFTSNEWYYSNLELEPDKYIDDGDLIYAWSASFGPFIWEGGKVIYHYHIWKMDLFSQENVDKYYLKNYLQAISAAIKASGNGIAMIHMTKERMEKLALPIPPLPEQHRIVAKVDELMAFCDQLEQTQSDNIAAHAQLVEALLATLITTDGVYAGNAGAISGEPNSSDHNELKNNWQRIAAHFDTLFTTEHSIDQLRQTILQLAVMGKLVPQNPNDEPASELLKKIAAEKAQLIKEGKIKKEKPLPEITGEEKPFELPSGWEFVRLHSISNIIAGNAFRSEDFSSETGARVIKITNAGVGEFIETNDYLPADFINTASQYLVSESDFILALTRPYIADGLKISKCPASYHNSLLNQRVAAIKINYLMEPEYFYQYFKSNFVLGVYLNRFGGSGLQPNLKMSDVTDLIFAVPPKKEQHRIVAKVDELMSLCDTLKTNLQHAQTTQLALADALVEQAIT